MHIAIGLKLELDAIFSATRRTPREFAYHRGWPEKNEHRRISCFCWAMYLRILRSAFNRANVLPGELNICATHRVSFSNLETILLLASNSLGLHT